MPTKRDDLSDAMALTLDRFFQGRAIWHGALWKHAATLSASQARWRPAAGRRCIWEIVRHVTYWRQWLAEHAAGRRAPDWRTHSWTMPERADAAAWRKDLRRLRESQKAVRAVFQTTTGPRLLERDRKGKFKRFWWIGVLAHDSYHTGQIATLRALMGLKPIA